MNSSEVTERSIDLYQANMLNGTFVVVVYAVDDDDDDVVEKRSPGIDPNFACQTMTDRNNIDVVGMMVIGQMKK